MIAVETLALAVCQNTVIKGITICDEDTNNDVTTAVLFNMTSAPTPFKPGALNKVLFREVLPRGQAPYFCTIVDKKATKLYRRKQ